MTILKRRKDEAECALVSTNPDGTKTYVCRVEEGKVFEVQKDKEGKVTLDAKMVVASPEDYKKIHNAIKEQSAPV